MEGVGTIDKVLAHAVGVAAKASTEAEILCSIRVEKGLLHLLLYLLALPLPALSLFSHYTPLPRSHSCSVF